ncbi:MAG: hypothetical protein RR320_02160, partial [Oscillospiraceae bacterium]
RGGLWPCAINGANEAAVALFLEGKLPFLQIGELVAGALSLNLPSGEYTVEDVRATDRLAREEVARRTGTLSRLAAES